MITWTTYKTTDGWKREVESTRTSHEGVVLTTSWTECERVMSDIYADVSYCLVWNADKGCAERVNLGAHFELNSTFGHAIVDATPEVRAAFEAWDAQVKATAAAVEKARREQAAKDAELAAWNRPEHGKRMTVVRGRKTPVGTTGEVFWMRDGRVGLALSDRKDPRNRHLDVAWVDAAYLVNALPLRQAA